MFLKLIILFLIFPSALFAQNTKPLIVTDNGSNTCNATRMVVSSGTLSCSGSVATVTTGGGGGSSQWTGSAPGNIYYNQGNVGIGTISATDILNINTPSSGGETISSSAMTNGIDSNAVLMAQLNGNATDASSNNFTITNTAVTFSSANYPYSSSISVGVFNGTTSFLSVPDSSVFDYGTGNFTEDGYFYFNSLSTSPIIMAQYQNASNRQFIIVNSDGSIQFLSDFASVQLALYGTTTGIISTGNWYHIALVRNGTSLLLFINGVSTTFTATTAIGTNDLGNISAPFTIGEGGGGSFLNGLAAGVRVSNIARWTSNFTPPTAPYSGAVGFPQLTLKVGTIQTGFIASNGNLSNTLQLGQGNNSAISISPTENVGIGSTAPGQALDVNGTVRISSLGTSASVCTDGSKNLTTSGCSGGGGTNFWLNNGGSNVGINTTQAVGIGTSFVGGTGEATLAVMNGNVGIGTWVPGAALQVNGSVEFNLGSDAGADIYYRSPSGALARLAKGSLGQILQQNSTSPSWKTSWTVGSGFISEVLANVGIGMSPPQYTLDIFDNIVTGFDIGDSTTGLWAITSLGAATFATVVSTGNVGIGSPNPSQALDVVGTIKTSGGVIAGANCFYYCNGGVDVGVVSRGSSCLCPAGSCVATNICSN